MLTSLNATTFKGLVDQAGLASVLQGPGPFTLLVPTNAAIAKIPNADLASVTANAHYLNEIIRYHVISDVHESHSFPFGRHLFLNSTNGHVIRVYRSAVALNVPEGTVIDILGNPDYQTSKFLELVRQAKLDTNYANPKYHVHSGTLHSASIVKRHSITTTLPAHSIAVTTNDAGDIILDNTAQITDDDIEAENGVVHNGKVGRVVSGRPGRVGRVVSGRPGRVGRVVSGRPGRAWRVVSVRTGRVRRVVSGRPRRVGRAVSERPGRVARVVSGRPRRVGRVVSERPGRVGRVVSGRPGRVGCGVSVRTGRVGRVVSGRPRRVGRAVSGRPGRVGRVVSGRPRRVGRVVSERPGRVGRVVSGRPGRVGVGMSASSSSTVVDGCRHGRHTNVNPASFFIASRYVAREIPE
ncbi:Y1735-like protein [Mya arenaria]|uniref:Y1735-like protein n=1 Tax=Mya arenaria TaxID=6604 RepID=A0ABY7DJV1_MYAAR|nr:Y1735-like protein [Mya arenaria]